MRCKPLVAYRQRAVHTLDERQSTRDRLMREAMAALPAAAGKAVHPLQHEIARSDVTRAATPWARMMDLLEANLRHARTLPAHERHEVRLAVERVIETMRALVMADDVEQDGCHLSASLSETKQQEIADEAQLRYAADPESAENGARVIAAITGHVNAAVHLRSVVANRVLRQRRAR